MEALYAEIAADPERSEPYLVLGDALIAANDQLGDLITTHNALLHRPDDRELALRAWRLSLPQLGALAPELERKREARTAVDPMWFMGFLRGVWLDGDDRKVGLRLTDMIQHLYTLPIARFLRDLRLGRPGWEEHAYQPALDTLAAIAPPYPLRALSLGDDLGDGGHWDRLYELGRLAPLYPRLAHLETLRIRGGEIDLGTPILPALRILELRLAAAHDDAHLARQLATGKLVTLEELELDFGPNANGDADLGFACDLPRLRRLALTACGDGDGLLARLCTSPAAGSLVELSIQYAGITDAGIDALCAHRGAFPWLSRIDFWTNDDISAEATERVQAAFA